MNYLIYNQLGNFAMDNTIEKIRGYKKLSEEGIISEEEFEQQKQKLLGSEKSEKQNNPRTGMFSPEGKVSRSVYVIDVFFWFCLSVVAYVVIDSAVLLSLILTLIAYGLLLISTIKRLRDAGLSTAFAILLFVPILGLATVVLLFLIPSKSE